MKPTGLLACLALLFALAAPVPADAQQTLQQRVEAALAEAPAGTRFGLVVTDESGRELVAVDPDGRFVPASNTKLLTTAAAFATLPGLDLPDAAGGATVRLEGGGAARDVILTGRGDARLSSAPDCLSNCLAALADAVAARARAVRHVIGDARLFVDDRWSPGMSWNNMPTRSGTAIAALSVDDNEAVLQATAGAAGASPVVASNGYFTLENRAQTRAADAAGLDVARLPGSRTLALTGSLAPGRPQTVRVGIDDPAHHAAWRLRQLLEARGVRVTGEVRSRYRMAGEPVPVAQAALASAGPAPLVQDIAVINKESQNLHAELLLRRIGLARGDASIGGGLAAIEAMMGRTGAPRTGWDLSDGSGMSTYNRVSPRAMVALLRWIAAQPWGETFRATLPVAGEDGTLRNRFRGTRLEGQLFAKTGSINAANALSGYMAGASGQLLTFAFFANDMPGGASATARMDALLLEVAAAN